MAKTAKLIKFGKLSEDSYKMAHEYIFMSISLMNEFSSVNKIELEYCLTNNFLFHPERSPRIRPFKRAWK